jgi:hypothetical protein
VFEMFFFVAVLIFVGRHSNYASIAGKQEVSKKFLYCPLERRNIQY